MVICSIARWKHRFFYKAESVKTTWTHRLAILAGIGLLAFVTRAVWIPEVGRRLMCAGDVRVGDVILVENFDPNYLLYKRAAGLQRARLARRILIPVESSLDEPVVPDVVARDITEVMVHIAGLQNVDFIPTRHTEPVTSTPRLRYGTSFTTRHLRSITVVAPAFRSRRSSLVYESVLAPDNRQPDSESSSEFSTTVSARPDRLA